MRVIYFVLYVLAAVCFAVAAFTTRTAVDVNGVRRGGGVNLVAAGLFCWVLVPLLQTVQTLDD